MDRVAFQTGRLFSFQELEEMEQDRKKLQEKYDLDTKRLEENAQKREQQMKTEHAQKITQLEQKHKQAMDALRKDLENKYASSKKVVLHYF